MVEAGATHAYSWTCAGCGRDNTAQLSKYQAAFFDSLAHPRCRCGHAKSASGSRAIPKIDAELLAHWLADSRLCFSSQDEDLLMADLQTQTIVGALPAKGRRRQALIGVLLVKVHDGIFQSDAERRDCLDWLRGRKKEWDRKPFWAYLRRSTRNALDQT